MKKINTKKQLLIFILVAYAVPYLLGIVMGIGYHKGLDLTMFPSAQMFYPAAGVMLAVLLTRKDDLIPKRFFISFIILTGLLIVASLYTVAVPGELAPVLNNIGMIGGSVVVGIILLTEKKEKRLAYGLRGANWRQTFGIVLVFLLLYLLRIVAFGILGGQAQETLAMLTDVQTWLAFVVTAVIYFISFAAYFGEEYGWRYYLQPLLQKKFGSFKGILVLGVVWGIWHLPINFFYYTSPSMGIISVVGQIGTCITLGIFFGYAYMKTKNIWSVVILHFFNNNLIPVFMLAAAEGEDVLQGQQVTWGAMLMLFAANCLLFGGFAATKYFKNKKYLLPTVNEQADQVAAARNEQA